MTPSHEFYFSPTTEDQRFIAEWDSVQPRIDPEFPGQQLFDCVVAFGEETATGFLLIFDDERFETYGEGQLVIPEPDELSVSVGPGSNSIIFRQNNNKTLVISRGFPDLGLSDLWRLTVGDTPPAHRAAGIARGMMEDIDGLIIKPIPVNGS